MGNYGGYFKHKRNNLSECCKSCNIFHFKTRNTFPRYAHGATTQGDSAVVEHRVLSRAVQLTKLLPRAATWSNGLRSQSGSESLSSRPYCRWDARPYFQQPRLVNKLESVTKNIRQKLTTTKNETQKGRKVRNMEPRKY